MKKNRTLITTVLAILTGSILGWATRPAADHPAARSVSERGKTPERIVPWVPTGDLAGTAETASHSGDIAALMECLSKMGPGAEELFKDVIRRAVRTALADPSKSALEIYMTLTQIGSVGSVMAGLEEIGRLRPDSAFQLTQILAAGNLSNPFSGHMMGALFKGWASVDYKQAERAITTLSEGTAGRLSAISGLIEGFVSRDPLAAAEMAMHGMSDYRPASALGVVFADWYKTDKDAAVAAITTEVAAASPRASALLVSHRLKTGTSMSELTELADSANSAITWAGLAEFASGRYDASGLTTAEALALLRTPGAMAEPSRDSALRMLAFRVNSGAGQVMDELPADSKKDGITDGVLKRMAVYEPEAGLSYLARENAIYPSAQMTRLYQQFLTTWLRTDPAAALSTTAASSDPAAKANLDSILKLRELNLDWVQIDSAAQRK